MIHTYLGETIQFEIDYKKRTSIGVTIDGYGMIAVQAPKGTPDHIVIQLVEEKWDFIQHTLKEIKDRTQGPQKKVYEYGENFLFSGKSYPIQIVLDIHITKEHVIFGEDKLRIYVNQSDSAKVKQALKRFYYQQCKALVEESISSYQKHFKTKPRSIRITDNKKTWGTCDSKLHLTFNWRLAMAPREVIDYVVVHEMCHMAYNKTNTS